MRRNPPVCICFQKPKFGLRAECLPGVVEIVSVSWLVPLVRSIFISLFNLFDTLMNPATLKHW